jgi:hypothetical protein
MCMHVRHTRGADLFTSTMPQCLHNRPVSNQLPEKEKKKKGTTASAFTECLQYLDVFGSTLPEHMPTGPKRQELGGGETTGNYHHYGPASLGRGA